MDRQRRHRRPAHQLTDQPGTRPGESTASAHEVANEGWPTTHGLDAPRRIPHALRAPASVTSAANWAEMHGLRRRLGRCYERRYACDVRGDQAVDARQIADSGRDWFSRRQAVDLRGPLDRAMGRRYWTRTSVVLARWYGTRRLNRGCAGCGSAGSGSGRRATDRARSVERASRAPCRAERASCPDGRARSTRPPPCDARPCWSGPRTPDGSTRRAGRAWAAFTG